MRKLATIQRIHNIRPIEGADRIVVADVLGWSVVVGKDEFKVGDLAVYFEIDSWCDSSIPAFQTDVFKARYSNWNGKTGMRLKTIKLRKQLSQGLLMPLSAFAELTASVRGLDRPQEGEDVTDILKIEKWEPAEETSSNNGGPNKTAGAGKFPSFLRKTDQERIQNYMHELVKHKYETFEVTIKLDGSSMSVFYVPAGSQHYQHVLEDMQARALRKKNFFGKLVYKARKFFGLEEVPMYFVGVCSRNLEVQDDGNHFYNYAKEYHLMDVLREYGRPLAIQGELIAPSIQENYENVKSPEFYVFDVFDIERQEYLPPRAARQITSELGLRYVPVIQESLVLDVFNEGRALDAEGTDLREVVDNILAFAEGPGMNTGVKREGLVFKSNLIRNGSAEEFSFKAISNSYLLKKEKDSEKMNTRDKKVA